MRLWYVFVPFILMGSLNAGYSALRNGPPGKLNEVRRECSGKAESLGLPRGDSVQLCNCLIRKARWFKWTHFGAEYTREVHHKLGMECVGELTASADQSSGWGTFGNEPPRSSRPLTGPGSGWGEAPDDEDEDETADRSTSSTTTTKQYGDPGYGTESE